jgi:voltage-gated potassium channel
MPFGLKRNDAKALGRYERSTALLVYAIAFLALESLVGWTDNSGFTGTAVWLYLTCWVLLTIDLLIRAYLSPRTGRFLAEHPFDVASVIFPPLRLLAVRRVWLIIRPQFDSPATALRGIMSIALTLVLVGGSFMALIEQDAPGSTITSVFDGIWWAFVTITTVGYGDEVPVTTSGRLLGMVVMAAGIAVWSVLTATIASRFNRAMAERVVAEDDVDDREVSKKLTRLEQRLEQVLSDRGAGDQPGGKT